MVLACFLACMSPVQADSLRVAVVLSEEGGAYRAFSDSLRSDLQAGKFALTFQRFDERLGVSDLYIAVGMKAASELASKDVPTLNVLVPRADYDKLQHIQTQHSKLHSAVFLDQPMERQLALLLAALPDTRHVGVLYFSPPPELPNLRRLLADKKILLHGRTIAEGQSLNDALENVLNESEVLFVLPDAEIYNAGTIRNILLTSYRKQVPLIGISQAYVKAGALCAIYSTPAQIATQTAEAVRLFAESGTLPSSQYPKEFEVSVNVQVARSLDLSIKDAEILRDEVRRAP